ncbi:TRAP transporter small permease [Dehalococcoidia bacterium]|nr:TRAP transporter small permease [Dehalococcoidia bacterium]
MEKHPKWKAEASEMPGWKWFIPFLHMSRAISAVETGLDIGGLALISFVMLFTVSEIVLRYVFHRPITGFVEITELVMAGLVFFGLAATQRVGGHVRMGLFIDRVLKGRLYHITESFTLLLALFVFVVVTVYTLEFALNSRNIGVVTPILHLPRWQSMLCIPIGSFLLCLRLVIQMSSHLYRAVVGVEKKEV